MGGWSLLILLRLSISEMLFCTCHLFRLELWCFVNVIPILFCYSWFCSLELGDKELWGKKQKEENNIIIMRIEAERAQDHQLSTSSSWGGATITPSTDVWQNMWTRINRAPPVLGTSTSSSHWGWQIEHGSACTSRNRGNDKSCILKRKGFIDVENNYW